MCTYILIYATCVCMCDFNVLLLFAIFCNRGSFVCAAAGAKTTAFVSKCTYAYIHTSLQLHICSRHFEFHTSLELHTLRMRAHASNSCTFWLIRVISAFYALKQMPYQMPDKNRYSYEYTYTHISI